MFKARIVCLFLVWLVKKRRLFSLPLCFLPPDYYFHRDVAHSQSPASIQPCPLHPPLSQLPVLFHDIIKSFYPARFLSPRHPATDTFTLTDPNCLSQRSSTLLVFSAPDWRISSVIPWNVYGVFFVCVFADLLPVALLSHPWLAGFCSLEFFQASTSLPDFPKWTEPLLPWA